MDIILESMAACPVVQTEPLGLFTVVTVLENVRRHALYATDPEGGAPYCFRTDRDAKAFQSTPLMRGQICNPFGPNRFRPKRLTVAELGGRYVYFEGAPCDKLEMAVGF